MTDAPRCWSGSARAARSWTDSKGKLAKQLEEARSERDELAVAERVLARMSEQVAAGQAATAPVPVETVPAQ